MTTEAANAKSPTETVRSLEPGKFTTLRKIEQGGALQARKLSTGAVQFYWRYTHEGKSDRVAIGTYDPGAPVKSTTPSAKGYSITAAAEACRARAVIQQQSAAAGGYRAHVAAEKSERERRQAAEAAERAAAAAALLEEERRAKYTLSALLTTYADHLEREERRSHRDARSIFRLHVEEAWPEVASMAANAVTDEQVADMLRRLVNAGKGRTANKLRSYLGAAYQCALKGRTSPTLPVQFKEFGVRANPAALTSRESKFDRADKRPLTLAQLRAYWRKIENMPGIPGAALRLHLLSGGQRIAQLVRVKNTDVTANAFVMHDVKGRPGAEPREHAVPLVRAAKKCVAVLKNGGEFLLSNDGGKTALRATTLSEWAKEVPHGIEGFQLKRIRSAVETALAEAQISREDRGHLQSHGLTGVQAKHYDDYNYIKNKRKALDALFILLTAAKQK